MEAGNIAGHGAPRCMGVASLWIEGTHAATTHTVQILTVHAVHGLIVALCCCCVHDIHTFALDSALSMEFTIGISILFTIGISIRLVIAPPLGALAIAIPAPAAA